MCLEDKMERIATALERIADQQLTLPLVTKEEKKGKKSQEESAEQERKPSALSPSEEKIEKKTSQKETSTQETPKVSTLPNDIARADLAAECERLGVVFDKKKATNLIFKALQQTEGSIYYKKDADEAEQVEVEATQEDITEKKTEEVSKKEVEYNLDDVRKELVAFAQNNGADKTIGLIRQASNQLKSKLVELTQVELNKVMTLLKGE